MAGGWIERLLFPRRRLRAGPLRRAVAGRTALVTGASRGIGAETAVLLARAGADVVIVARDAEGLARTAKRIRSVGRRAHLIVADLRSDADLDRVLMDPSTATVSILISNAGHSIHRPHRASIARHHDLTRTMAINYLAPARLVSALTSQLAATAGIIVNVSSLSALLPPAPSWGAYHASKAAFDQWLRAAAPELEAAGVRVSAVYLPLVRTAMSASTPAYRQAPAMSAGQAALHVARSIAGRRAFRPWWSVPLILLTPALSGVVAAVFRIRARRAARVAP